MKDDKTSLPSDQRGALASSARVTLRYPCLEDQAEYVELVKASRDLHRPWEPERPEGAPRAASQEAFTAWLVGADDPRTERMLLCQRADGAIVGRFHLNEIVRGAFCSAYMSYWVGAPFAGQGLMREGIGLVLEHAFNAVNLHRVEANIQPRNAASIALVKGAGFRLEGYSERYLEIAGEWADHERWAMTAEEWRARAGASDPSS